MISRIAFILLILIPLTTQAQRRINRYRHSERQGKWIVYQDTTNRVIDNIGRYRKGIPKGTWRYYDADAHLVKIEKHRFRKIYTTQYYSNGAVKRKGKAKIVITDSLIHYFYYGEWLVYDSLGELTKTQIFRNGEKISETQHKTSSEKNINDSLVDAVRNLSKQLYLYSDSLQLAEQSAGKKSALYSRYASLNNLNALKVLDDIDKIIRQYGYPGKTLVGKEYAIVFSIISSAALPYKEKYYDVIIAAADKGELDWTDVAFFVDKIKVAKKEKQVYGTQYHYDEKLYQMFYYPIDDPGNLNARRKKAGLSEMDLSYLEFTSY